MKVILLKEQKGIGQKGDIVNVSDGFAFNNLIPRGIAKAVTQQVLAQVEKQKAKEQKELDTQKADAVRRAQQIDKKKINITAQAKGDKLFGSVTSKDIAAAIKEQHGIEVAEKAIKLADPIKELTTCEVRIEHGFNVESGVIVTITSK